MWLSLLTVCLAFADDKHYSLWGSQSMAEFSLLLRHMGLYLAMPGREIALLELLLENEAGGHTVLHGPAKCWLLVSLEETERSWPHPLPPPWAVVFVTARLTSLVYLFLLSVLCLGHLLCLEHHASTKAMTVNQSTPTL